MSANLARQTRSLSKPGCRRRRGWGRSNVRANRSRRSSPPPAAGRPSQKRNSSLGCGSPGASRHPLQDAEKRPPPPCKSSRKRNAACAERSPPRETQPKTCHPSGRERHLPRDEERVDCQEVDRRQIGLDGRQVFAADERAVEKDLAGRLPAEERGAESETAIVWPLRLPTKVTEHFWTATSADRTSISRSGRSPGN